MLAKAYVEITNVCNRKCAFCPGTHRTPRFMRQTEFAVMLRRLQGHTKFLYFHLMGEPLLHPELACFLEMAGAAGYRVILTTNGTLLQQRQAELLHAPALHKVNISLHSFEANTGDDLTDYVAGCAQFAKAASAQGILSCLRLWNLDGDLPGLNRSNAVILQILEQVFPRPWQENSRGWRLQNKAFLEWGERFAWPEMEAEELAQQGFCYGLRDQVGVLCDGTVVPCCLDHEGDIALGNLLQQPLEEILASARAAAIYQGFSQRKITEELCRRCGYARRFG